jgi:hypothetical protein
MLPLLRSYRLKVAVPSLNKVPRVLSRELSRHIRGLRRCVLVELLIQHLPEVCILHACVNGGVYR